MILPIAASLLPEPEVIDNCDDDACVGMAGFLGEGALHGRLRGVENGGDNVQGVPAGL